MNIKLYTYYGAPDVWIDYSEFGGELDINAIYSGSDPQRVDMTDFMAEDVIKHAFSRIRTDYAERI